MVILNDGSLGPSPRGAAEHCRTDPLEFSGQFIRRQKYPQPLLIWYLRSYDRRLPWNALEHNETPWYSLQRFNMPVTIEDMQYHTAVEVTKELGISRTTLWRWRSDGKIPAGRLYRGGTVVFTSEEFDAIRAFANRLEPVQALNRDQMSLFNGGRRGE